MKYKRWVILFGVLALLVSAFIWSNSLRSMAETDQLNRSVSKVVKPRVDPDQRVDSDLFHTLMSKAAHIVEFGLLGLCVGGFAISLGRLRQRRYYALPLLLVLTVGVTDELIQSFTDRTSAVTDVVIDFAGALLGLGLAALLFRLSCKWAKVKTSG